MPSDHHASVGNPRTAALCWVAACLAVACSTPRDAPPEHAADLLAPINAPILLEERQRIDAADPLFFGGFYRAEVPADGPSKRWLGDRPGHVRIALLEHAPRSRRLVLELRAAKRPEGSPLRVAVRFDGAQLATLDCSGAWAEHSVTVPAELAGFGAHRLELVPDTGSPAAAETGGRRPRTIVLRSIHIDPVRPGSAPPRLDDRGLHLPPGTAATWAFWVPEGARPVLQADGLPAGTSAPFIVLSDDQPPRRIAAAELARLAGQPVILALSQPHEATRPLRVRRLWLDQGAPRPPVEPAREPGRSLLVVGRLERGFAVTPCSSDPERALQCLLSGRESAAYGLPVPTVYDLVSEAADAVEAYLSEATPSALAALVQPAAPARSTAERLRRVFPDLEILLAGLPGGAADLTVLADTLEPASRPVNARDLDLTATLLSAAGRPVPATLDGISLAPFLDGSIRDPVRPAATVWLDDGPLAVVGGQRFGSGTGGRGLPATVLEAAALAFSERRLRSARWLSRERPPDWGEGQGRRADR